MVKKGRINCNRVAKVSTTKVSNKKLYKLGKQGKLKKAKYKRKKLEQEVKRREKETEEGGPPEEVEEEEELEEEDLEYFGTPGRDISFLTNLKSDEQDKSKKKTKAEKQKEQEAECDYERRPRSFHGDDKEYKVLLPIKGQDGVIPRLVEIERQEEVNGDVTQEEEKKEEEDEEEEEPLPPVSMAELFARRRQKLQDQKQKMARLASSVIENPHENVRKLKDLREMLLTRDPDVCVTIKKIGMVSLMEIFKDIIPSYRIREVSEQEKKQQVKQETKVLRDFEDGLCHNYRLFLEFLETMAKGLKQKKKRDDKKKHMNSHQLIPKEAEKSLQEIGIRCLCDLLVAHPHFNYRSNIITLIIPFMGHKNTKISDTICNSVRTIFRNDREGYVSLEITRLISRFIKAKSYGVQPKVLRVFLGLRIKEVDLKTGGDKKKEEKKMTHKEKKLKFSRNERKREKHMRQLEDQLEDITAAKNQKKRLRTHTDIMEAVFLVYFMILKKARRSILLSEVLEGLAKFAHCINLEFFDDLFKVINELIAEGELTHRQSLHCVQTALTILSGQGAALNIDPLAFYRHLYTNLIKLHAGSSNEDIPIVLQCLDMMINKRRKQVSWQRVLAFIKRCSILGLQVTSHSALGLLFAIRTFVHSHPKSDVLLDTETTGSGVYLPELDEPEHCNAHNTTLWELTLFRRHYHPVVRKVAIHLSKGAPITGDGQLPAEYTRKTPVDLFKEFDSSQMKFNPAIQAKVAKKSPLRAISLGFIQEDMESLKTDVINSLQDLKLPSPPVKRKASEVVSEDKKRRKMEVNPNGDKAKKGKKVLKQNGTITLQQRKAIHHMKKQRT